MASHLANLHLNHPVNHLDILHPNLQNFLILSLQVNPAYSSTKFLILHLNRLDSHLRSHLGNCLDSHLRSQLGNHRCNHPGYLQDNPQDNQTHS